MTQRIAGWTAPDVDIHPGRLAVSFVLRANKNPDDVPCVAVIGDERVFTESEVKALLLSIDAAIMQDRAQMAIMHEAKKRGIILDPA